MNNSDETKAWREAYQEYCEKQIPSCSSNLQDVFTPYELCYDIISKLETFTALENKTFAVFNLEYIDILMYNYGVKASQIWFITDCKEKRDFCLTERYKDVNVSLINYGKFLKEEIDMKFDCVIMNPLIKLLQTEAGLAVNLYGKVLLKNHLR